ncbi:MAG: hypothetical protein V4488_22660, partial [Pseudomonadota bacterium]
FGVPDYAVQKMGNGRNSLRSDTPVSDPFSVPHNRRGSKRFASQRQQQIQKQLQPDSPFSNETCSAKIETAWLGVGVVVDVVFDLPPLGTLHFALRRKWIRNERCLSVASFVHFPFFVMRKM